MRRALVLAAFLVPVVGWPLRAPQVFTYTQRGTTRLQLDYYRPPRGPALPLIVVFHGGGWVSGNRSDMSAVCVALSKEGYAVASVSYRFAPKDLWPAQLEDARAAVRYLRANAERLRLKPDKVAALGFSAGGHLSSWLGVSGRPEERVQAVVSIAGIHDLAAPLTKEGEAYRIVQKLLGPNDPKGRPAASPITKVDAKSAPHYFIQGGADPLVPPAQSKAMLAKLQARKVPAQFELVPKMVHGIDLTKAEQKAALARAVSFVRKHGVR